MYLGASASQDRAPEPQASRLLWGASPPHEFLAPGSPAGAFVVKNTFLEERECAPSPLHSLRRSKSDSSISSSGARDEGQAWLPSLSSQSALGDSRPPTPGGEPLGLQPDFGAHLGGWAAPSPAPAAPALVAFRSTAWEQLHGRPPPAPPTAPPLVPPPDLEPHAPPGRFSGPPLPYAAAALDARHSGMHCGLTLSTSPMQASLGIHGLAQRLDPGPPPPGPPGLSGVLGTGPPCGGLGHPPPLLLPRPAGPQCHGGQCLSVGPPPGSRGGAPASEALLQAVHRETQVPMHELAALEQQGALRQIPRDADGRLTSVGTIHHAAEACSPCLFWFKGACTKGLRCSYCHLKHQGQKNKRIRPSKAARQRMREEAGLSAQGGEGDEDRSDDEDEGAAQEGEAAGATEAPVAYAAPELQGLQVPAAAQAPPATRAPPEAASSGAGPAGGPGGAAPSPPQARQPLPAQGIYHMSL